MLPWILPKVRPQMFSRLCKIPDILRSPWSSQGIQRRPGADSALSAKSVWDLVYAEHRSSWEFQKFRISFRIRKIPGAAQASKGGLRPILHCQQKQMRFGIGLLLEPPTPRCAYGVGLPHFHKSTCAYGVGLPHFHKSTCAYGVGLPHFQVVPGGSRWF